MFPHAQRFEKWLRRRNPHTATPVHYTNDLKLFFAWAGKPPDRHHPARRGRLYQPLL
jgi:hypothetical protein